MEAARRIQQQGSRLPRWIDADALCELTGAADVTDCPIGSIS